MQVSIIVSSGYFIYLGVELSRFIVEFHYRFNKVIYALESFFKLTDEEKLKSQNLELLNKGESDSKLLLDDFKNSNVIKKLKKKYFIKWHKENINKQEKKTGKKKSRKAKKEILSYFKKELSKNK